MHSLSVAQRFRWNHVKLHLRHRSASPCRPAPPCGGGSNLGRTWFDFGQSFEEVPEMTPQLSQATNPAYDFDGPQPTNACLRHAAKRCGGKMCDGWRSVKWLCWGVWCLPVGSLFASSSSVHSWLAKSQHHAQWQRGRRGRSCYVGAATVRQTRLRVCSCGKARPRKRMLPHSRAFEYCPAGPVRIIRRGHREVRS